MASVIVWVVHLSLIVWGTRAVLNRLDGEPLRNWWVPALAFKVLMGWLLGAVFFWYYQQGDTIHYFDDATQLATMAYRQPGVYLRTLLGIDAPPPSLTFIKQPRALYFTKLVSLLNIVTFNNYWLSAAYLSIFSAASSWVLANYLSKRFVGSRLSALIAFLFYPSVAFWGAGLLKESVAVTALMLIVWIALRIDNRDIKNQRIIGLILLLVLAVWLLWQVKYYYAGVLLPTLSSAVISRHISRCRGDGLATVWFVVIFVVLASSAGLLHPRLRLDYLMQSLVENHNTIVRMSAPGSTIEFWSLARSCDSLARNLPWALLSGLFRPLVGEGRGVLAMLVGLENALLLLLAVGAIVRSPIRKMQGKLWMIAAVVYIAVLASLLAIASPNFGSLMRYKVSFLPFMVFLCLMGNRSWLFPRQSKDSPTQPTNEV